MTRENPAGLYDLLWRCSDLGIELEAVNSTLIVSGREADIEPLSDVLRRANDQLVMALSPHGEVKQ